MDRNGDGKITEAELVAYLDHQQELQKRATAGCVTLELSDQSRGLFDMLDTDRDGRLSVRELRRAPKLLQELDRAGKGHLTRADVPRTYRLEVRRGPVNQGGLGGANAIVSRYLTPYARTEPERRSAARCGSARWTATATATSRARSSSSARSCSARSTPTATG